MKYKDLIAESFVIKLLQTTFKNPSTNIKIWKFYQAVKPCYEFLFNENKKHNCDEKYFSEILQCDLEFELPKLDLSFDDFEEEKCEYSQDKRYWLNAIEINAVVNWCKTQKEIIEQKDKEQE